MHIEHGVLSLLCAYNTMQWCIFDVWRTGKIPSAWTSHEIKQGSIVIILSSSDVLRVLVHTLIRISSVVVIMAWHNVAFILLQNNDKATNEKSSGHFHGLIHSINGWACHSCLQRDLFSAVPNTSQNSTQCCPYLKADLPTQYRKLWHYVTWTEKGIISSYLWYSRWTIGSSHNNSFYRQTKKAMYLSLRSKLYMIFHCSVWTVNWQLQEFIFLIARYCELCNLKLIINLLDARFLRVIYATANSSSQLSEGMCAIALTTVQYSGQVILAGSMRAAGLPGA